MFTPGRRSAQRLPVLRVETASSPLAYGTHSSCVEVAPSTLTTQGPDPLLRSLTGRGPGQHKPGVRPAQPSPPGSPLRAQWILPGEDSPASSRSPHMLPTV